MGRPKELTDEQRADLLARGYRRMEVWVADRNNENYRKDVERQARSAAEADERDGSIDNWVAGVRGNLWDDEAP